jgi:hypothetical protein
MNLSLSSHQCQSVIDNFKHAQEFCATLVNNHTAVILVGTNEYCNNDCKFRHSQ